MSRVTSADARRMTRFPRVSGDEPIRTRLAVSLEEFSPRERG